MSRSSILPPEARPLAPGQVQERAQALASMGQIRTSRSSILPPEVRGRGQVQERARAPSSKDRTARAEVAFSFLRFRDGSGAGESESCAEDSEEYSEFHHVDVG